MQIKIILSLIGCLLISSCGSDENTDTNTVDLRQQKSQEIDANVVADIKNKIEEAKNNPGSGDKYLNPEGQVLFTLFELTNPADMSINFFKNIVSCKMPTPENSAILLEAYKTEDLNSPLVKINGNTQNATLYFDLGDGQTFTGTGKILGDSLDELGFYLTLQPAEGSTATSALSLTGGYFCPQ